MNADVLVLIGSGIRVINNAFSYCNNRFIDYADYDGKIFSFISNAINNFSKILEEVKGTWRRLTKSEKFLAVLEPKQALIVKGCQETTDKIVSKRFPDWTDGDKGNAFRHALWNALMKQAFFSGTTAKMWADAHEDYPDEMLAAAEPWNGFDAYQHREMDYHNNALGRNSVAWYEFWLTPEEIADRILEKLDAGEGMILVE